MSGALMQLVAVGAQNVHLIDNAGPSLFKAVYTRKTNFAMESIRQTFDGTPRFGGKASVTVERKGDLLRGLVLEVVMKRDVSRGEPFYPAEHLVREVDLEIGGQRIDTVTSTWMRIHDELYRRVDAREAYRAMADFADAPDGSVKRMYLPLPFWFCKCSASALPLIALQYHQVRLNFTFEDAANIPGIDPNFPLEINLWGDYVYLDTDERRRFAREPHEYLIEQTQVHREPITVTSTLNTTSIVPAFNHPAKYFAWVLKPSRASNLFTSASTGLVADETYGPVASAVLQLNGAEVARERKGSYYRLPHAFDAFGMAPSVGVYVFSFALHPSSAALSGSMNCSRIDSIKLRLTTKKAVLEEVGDATEEDQTLASAKGLTTVELYARSYNVLRVVSGMGGLAYSN